jgi:hypothetical protein
MTETSPVVDRQAVITRPPTGITRRSTRPAWSTCNAGIVIDMVEGNSAADLRRWLAAADPEWLAGIEVGATDLARELPSRLVPGHRCAHGMRSFEHCRVRVLLYTGGVTWPCRPCPPRIRTRAPYSNA